MQNSPLVSIRRARWRIVDARSFDDCTLLTVTPVDAGGESRSFLTPFDEVIPIAAHQRPRRVGTRRWRHACRSLIAGVAGAGSLRSVARARIDVMPHQLEPALAILHGLATRLLIADEVGLGKTIQAAIVAAELLERHLIDRVLVVAPAGLRDQWRSELAGRFQLPATVVDAAMLRRSAALLPVGVNPWSVSPIAIASADYIKRAEVLSHVAACRWDLVIVDEAHASAGDSDRRSAMHVLASQAAYVLLLTATPHNGDDAAFESLCNIGAFARRGQPAQDDDLPLVMFRRSRHAIRGSVRRHMHTLTVRSTPQHARMHALLDAFMVAVCAERPDGWLAASVLHKRAWSSAWSLARSIDRRIAALTASDKGEMERSAQLTLPWQDPDGERSNEDDAPAWPSAAALGDSRRELQLLRRLAAASTAAASNEPKLHAIARLLRRTREPVIVFTEYRDTLFHLLDSLACPAAVIHGGLTRQERAAAIARFTSGHIRLLLATDVASEGLNLHERCRLVVNLELPWNPMRLEQRIGRVDRIGQQRPVHAVHLIGAGTREVRVLARLRERLARAAAVVDATDRVGADEERTVAHIAVFDRPDDVRSVRRDQRPAPPSVDVVEAADAEAGRIAFARSLNVTAHRPGATDFPDRPLMMRAHPALRAHMCGHMLLVWRVSLDASGHRSFASTLVGASVDVPATPLARSAAGIAESLARDERVLELVHAAIGSWRQDAERTVQAWLAARMRRERAIESVDGGSQTPLFQPGLFDRRSERARLAAAAMRAAATSDRSAAVAQLEREIVGATIRITLSLVAYP